MVSPLVNYLQSFNVLPAGMVATVCEGFDQVRLKRNQFFLKEGQVCKTLGFVESGLLVYYRLAENGQEIVADFAQENEWVCQYQSFINSVPSALFIKAVEPCVIHTITLDNLNRLYSAIPGFEKLAKQLIEAAFMQMVNRQLEFQHLRAEERYERMLLVYPSVAQRVPQYYIASFLGIAPPSLSRIRKNRAG